MTIAKNATLIESTKRYSIFISPQGDYTIQRHADQKDIFIQGEAASLLGQTLGNIRGKYRNAPDIPAAENAKEGELDWLCASEFGE